MQLRAGDIFDCDKHNRGGDQRLDNGRRDRHKPHGPQRQCDGVSDCKSADLP